MQKYEYKNLTEYHSLRGECPYHKAGCCHNPLFRSPTTKYTSPDRCQTKLYVTCRWYKIAKEYGDKL